MNYETALNSIVTKSEAIKEVKDHGCDVNDFLNDVGNKSEYLGSEILHWLGY